eukprot:4951067-Amphidinium_carterae.1
MRNDVLVRVYTGLTCKLMWGSRTPAVVQNLFLSAKARFFDWPCCIESRKLVSTWRRSSVSVIEPYQATDLRVCTALEKRVSSTDPRR